MAYKFSEFPGIDSNHVTRLRDVAIENTDDMMRVWADEKKRSSLVEKTGISLEQFAKLASMARLARVKNVGPQYVEVLLAAGIDGPKSLFENTPSSLVKRLAEVKDEQKLTGEAPALTEVTSWFMDGKRVSAGA